jgi:LytTr DNA-binding domain
MNCMSDVKNAQESPGVEPVWDKSQPERDGARRHGISGVFAGISGADWLFYAAVGAVAVGIGFVNAYSKAQDVAWRGGAYDARTQLFWELTSIAVIMLLVPILFVAVRRMRHTTGWLLRIGIAVAAILIFSSLHIAGMIGLRKAVLFLAGVAYDSRFSIDTLIYEFRKDVITCLLIGGARWLLDGYRKPQPGSATAPAGPPSTPHMVWLRDGSTRIRIEPADILWVSSAGNYVEYRLAGGVDHLVRGTLAAEETRLTRFNIVRVHRTRLVNLDRVNGLKAGPNGDFELTLDTGQVIAGSRRYRGAVASINALATDLGPVPDRNDAHSS